MKRTAVSIIFFILFFLGICFVTTANTILFLQGADLQEYYIREQAPKVFLNIIILSFLFTGLTFLVRYFTSTRHVKDILDFSDRVSKGDYTIRLNTRETIFDPYGYTAIKNNLNKMVEELGSVETLRTDFISNVSHELKTPLAAIQNYATLIQTPALSENEKSEYTRQIVQKVANLSALITNILKLNKLENQKIFPTVKEINVSELVCECMLGFEQTWEEKNIQIEADIAEETAVFTDSELLKIVVNNLISNALKFTEPGGTVGIKVEGFADDGAVISVSDTGCGMDSKTGNHIFERFYQGDTSHNGQGNGLGLALVKQIIDILGYEIQVESEVGVGSTFTVICK
ncbi:MAG: HAMP domain-containing histidine kinase [Treponemataceae bacterium]|nr:HAMP domain-containing histidine kinase [Treponemataceae bacterium]